MSTNQLNNLLPSFELHLRAEAKSPKTVRIYRAAVIQFVGWLAVTHPEIGSWGDVGRDHLREWTVETIERTSAGNASVQWRGLQQFLKWAEIEDEIEASPMRNLSGPQPTPPLVPVIEIRQLAALLAAVAGPGFIERRDNAIIRLLIDTGIRRGELVGLKLDDVQLFEREATVTGKGAKTRTVRFGAKTAKAIDRYLRTRRTHAAADLPRELPARARTAHAKQMSECHRSASALCSAGAEPLLAAGKARRSASRCRASRSTNSGSAALLAVSRSLRARAMTARTSARVA